MQYAVFKAQKSYAASGNADLESLLINLLIDRSSAIDLKRIVLNEAIDAAGKVTPEQLDTMSFVLLFVQHAPLRYRFSCLSAFGDYLRQYVAPLINSTVASPLTYRHLKYTGCVSMDSGGVPMTERIRQTFPACFTEGFDETTQPALTDTLRHLLIPAFHTATALQLPPMDYLTLTELLGEYGFEGNAVNEIWHMQSLRGLDIIKTSELLRQFDRRFTNLDEPSYAVAMMLGDVQLTTVGIALANANLKHRVGLEFDLGHWIA
jgi:hypothetical protein